jgi:phage shock protein A
MSIFKRLFKIGQAETNSAIDKLEEPIAMTEQGIRDMKSELEKGLHALAEIKALAIRSGKDVEQFQLKAHEYEQKAIQLLQEGYNQRMNSVEADRLATEALVKKANLEKQAEQAKTEKSKLDQSVAQMEGNVLQLKENITKWEEELRSLKARVKVSAATASVNKQLAKLDPSGTESMLDRMKEKVAQQEALAQAYGDMAESNNRTVDQEINKALEGAGRSKAEMELTAMKAKLGMISLEEVKKLEN